MDLTKDYYDILKISKNAEDFEVVQAYTRLAIQWHPSRASADQRREAQEKFKLIVEAYYVLSHPELRNRYDSERNEAFKGTSKYFFAGESPTPLNEEALAAFYKKQLANRQFIYIDTLTVLGGLPARIAATLIFVFFAFFQGKMYIPLFVVTLMIVWDEAKSFLGSRSRGSDTVLVVLCWLYIALIIYFAAAKIPIPG